MNQTLIASLFYFVLFAGIGFSRGLRREMLVLGISGLALAACVLLQSWAHELTWASLSAGWDGRPTWSELAPKFVWLDLRQNMQNSPVPMALWLSACGGAYWYTQTRMQQGKKPRRVLGAGVSICSGALYLNLMVPLLSRSLSWPSFEVLPPQSVDIAVRATSLLNAAIANRSALLTVLAIAVLIYLVSRRRQPNG